jgi:serine/threonine protein kinase
VESALRSLEEEWRDGEPVLEQYWVEHDPGGTVSVLAALVKADLRCRFARGGRPTANDYLERFPILRSDGERALSLIYEEFCLREERGERPDADSFCERYAPWRDSLASQLKYHQLLSRVVGCPSSPPPFPEPGDRFQEFAIDSVLGQGGAARVYRARNDLLGGRQVALKISPDRGHEPSIMGRLDHEHIVPVHSVVFQAETRLRGLIMPYRPGLPLDEVIRRVNPASRPSSARVLWEVVSLPDPSLQRTRTADAPPGWGGFPMRGTYPRGVAWLIATLAGAVAHAHGREIHHRDIKPANVLLTRDYGPQLLDFNLAHDPHAAEQAEAALRGGTLPYMAPEQLEAFLDPARWHSVGAAADLYSVGLVMYELLTGQPPELPDQSFPLPRAIRSLLDRRVDQRFSPRKYNPSIPHALEAITVRCLAYSAAERYPNAQALADDLEQFLKHKPLLYAVNPSVPERIGTWCRRHRTILACTTVVAALTALTAIGFVVQQLIPGEYFPSFHTAVEAVEHGEHKQAVELLEPMVDRYPGSPLVQLYGAVAYAKVDEIQKAARLFKLASEAPGADALFNDWARKHPSVVHQFESLGVKLYDGIPNAPREISNPFLEQVHKALSIAIRLGSTDVKVHVYDALCDMERSHYPRALDKLDRLIARIEGDPPETRDRCLVNYGCYFYRARILIHAGNSTQPDASEELLTLAEFYYDRALSDIERGELLLDAGDTERRDNHELLRVSAELGLGELAILRQQRNVAQAHYDCSNSILERQDSRHGDEPSFLKLLNAAVELNEKIRAMPSPPSSVAVSP